MSALNLPTRFEKPKSKLGDGWRGLDIDGSKPLSNMAESHVMRKRPPINSTQYFRLNLCSDHGIASVANNTWTFVLNIPEELEAGVWHVCADTVTVSGSAPSAAAADRIVDFHVQGLPLRDNYTASSAGESTLLVSHARTASTSSWTRNVTTSTLGTPLADLGQIRGRQIIVSLRNGANVLHPDNGVTNWRLVLCFYLHDA